ncbi:MAG TPA: EscU/YscU/HrcU family type III secretion system export apparatus switch protein [Caulobacteraceae bacterium]|nr:EscU/YscU/HrcU family type III secretion system export apparatus switch protein [Caulobacteraceae bacterium]
MSQDGVEQNRSEAPTPFKLRRARDKGVVARGLDLGFLTGLAAFTGYVWIAGPDFLGRLARATEGAFVTGPQSVASPSALMALTGGVFSAAVQPVAFLAVTVFVAVLVFEIIQTGFVFSTEPLRPDFNRLNPAQGLKRVFSVRMLIESAKNVLKLFVYAAIAYFVIREAEQVAVAAIGDARSLAETLGRIALKLLVLFAAAAVFFAGLDQLIVRRDFLRRMRMSRREIRRELRDREGEPRMKQRRKQLHAEFVKMSQSLRGVRGADVMITNPTHFAVALKYDAASMDAPQVVALGAHRFALRLRALAFAHGVVIVHRPELARALYRASEVGLPIGEAFFRPVADIYLELRERADQRKAAAHA